MSDMYGALRSNEFKVKDIPSFLKWFEGYSFGDETQIWHTSDGVDGDGLTPGKVSFGGTEQYPNAYPMRKILDEDGYIEEVEEADLTVFADELRQHLQPDEMFHVVAGGNEKLCYVGFSALIIAEDVDAPSFQVYYSDDEHDTLRARMKGDSTS